MKKIWFKRKTYGWGWTPATWQGWAITALYIIVIISAGLTIDQASGPQDIAFTFFLPILLATVAFIRIAYRTGEKPAWRWGKDTEHKK